MSKSKKLIKLDNFLDFFILKVKLAFIKVKQIFIKTLIFYHFNLEYYI